MKLKTSVEQQRKTVSKLNRPHKKWEKIFASYISDKGLITRSIQRIQKTKLPKNQWPNKEMGN
jgi:hypothetical protein